MAHRRRGSRTSWLVGRIEIAPTRAHLLGGSARHFLRLKAVALAIRRHAVLRSRPTAIADASSSASGARASLMHNPSPHLGARTAACALDPSRIAGAVRDRLWRGSGSCQRHTSTQLWRNRTSLTPIPSADSNTTCPTKPARRRVRPDAQILRSVVRSILDSQMHANIEDQMPISVESALGTYLPAASNQDPLALDRPTLAASSVTTSSTSPLQYPPTP